MTGIPKDKAARLDNIIDLAWNILFQRIVANRTTINKEASMQLHLSTILHGVGEFFCIQPGELFDIELESKHQKCNIDIVCSLGDVKAALELKCFRKQSDRATDIDMYDALKDICRLQAFDGFQVKRFICLTDNPYYVSSQQTGHASAVSVKHGTIYQKDTIIQPTWVGRWKDASRDAELKVLQDINCTWESQEGWYFLNVVC